MKRITIFHTDNSIESKVVKDAASNVAGVVWYIEEREGREVEVILSHLTFKKVEIGVENV